MIRAEAAKARSRATIRRRLGRSRRWARRRGTTSAPTSTLSSAGSKCERFTEAGNRAVNERQTGESKNDASNTYNTNNSTTQAVGEAHGQARGETRGNKKREAGTSVGQGSSGSAGAGALQAVQAGLGGDRGTDCECAGHAVCLPVLPEVAPRSRPGTRIQEHAAGTLGPRALRGGLRTRWRARHKDGHVGVAPCAEQPMGGHAP